MSIIKLDGNDPFEDLSRFPTMPSVASMQKAFVPALDMYEDAGNIIVEAPLAGISPEDVEVSVEGGMLSISGKSHREHEVDDKNYYRKEVRGGSFYRQVSLPVKVNEDKVTAEFGNGVLRITAPKVADAETKKISINVVKKDS